MPIARGKALESMKNSGLEVSFITQKNLHEWIVADSPLHLSYPYLSAVHRADYLRVYFMHHYGGGYSDIKNINDSWLHARDQLLNSNKYGVGYREVGPKGVAMIRSWRYIILLYRWRLLLGNGAYIFKPHSRFTFEWLRLTEEFLDKKYVELKKNPASHPEDYSGRKLKSNQVVKGYSSSYPIRWSEMLGDIFHPLCLKYSSDLLNTLPAPDLVSSYDWFLE